MFSSGKFIFNNEDISKKSESAAAKIRAKQIGFVKQDFALIEEYSALDNVMLPLYPIKAQNKKKKSAFRARKNGDKIACRKGGQDAFGRRKTTRCNRTSYCEQSENNSRGRADRFT